MLAKDVMTTNVISVSEAAPVHEVVDLLLKYRIRVCTQNGFASQELF